MTEEVEQNELNALLASLWHDAAATVARRPGASQRHEAAEGHRILEEITAQ